MEEDRGARVSAGPVESSLPEGWSDETVHTYLNEATGFQLTIEVASFDDVPPDPEVLIDEHMERFEALGEVRSSEKQRDQVCEHRACLLVAEIDPGDRLLGVRDLVVAYPDGKLTTCSMVGPATPREALDEAWGEFMSALRIA